MKTVRLGCTELLATKPAMGCLPIQRCGEEYAIKLLQAAYDGGIRFFDTSRAYSDSERKIGAALSDVRSEIVIATKSRALTKDGILRDIETSLSELRTDHVDIFQFHQAKTVFDPDDPDGPYAGAVEAKRRGWIGHIGVSTHRVDVAEGCISSGLFETLQFPFSYISAERDLALAEKCREADMGYIAMKGLAGGMLTNVRACHAFMNSHDNVVPIWGIQKLEELQQWLDAAKEDPVLDDELSAFIRKERQELAGSFCRSCGYCMPCSVGIEIYNCARMNMLLRRSPWQPYFTPEWQEKMAKIDDCIGCGLCASRCPYQLDTPNLLKYMLKDYREFYEAHKDEL